MQAIADWIKHAFISKFNHINANVYDDFARVLRKDILNCHKDKVILDQTYAITKRVGLAQVRREGTGRDGIQPHLVCGRPAVGLASAIIYTYPYSV
jgi:Eukaryotic membrane protein family